MKKVEVEKGGEFYHVSFLENGIIKGFFASFNIGLLSDSEAKKEAEALAKKMRKKFQTRVNNEEGC